jgi:hypothetical protein
VYTALQAELTTLNTANKKNSFSTGKDTIDTDGN